MYEICINDELSPSVYRKLIEYSFDRSDAFMLVTYRYSEDIESRYEPPAKDESESEEVYLGIVNYLEQSKKRAYKNRYIFNENTEFFLEKLKPYLVKRRNSPTEWPGIEVWLNERTNVDICVYKVCDKVKPYLFEAEGLFNWRYPYFPDDLSFFKNGYCWFYTVAHEEYSFMYVKSEEEVKMLEKMGLNFKVSECNYDESKLFCEDYEL